LEKVLSINNLDKRYGKIHAVNNLSFDIEKGCVFGVLGPNGSGKTTTLGIILSVISANGGTYSWFGEPPSKESRKRIGAILEHPIFYPYLSAERNLQIICDIKGAFYSEIEGVLETVELLERKDSKFRTYSYGMKQRLAIASALLGNPEVLIFDEPTNGLDPKGIHEIRELIIKIAKGGTTIILASHLLDEVQKTCSHVLVLKNGQKLFEGKVDEVLASSILLEIASKEMESLRKVLLEFEGVKDIKEEEGLLIAKLEEDVSAYDVNKYCIEKGIVLTRLSLRKKSLEKQFLELLSQSE
jgi:ABC-2 type transport system ATP-binding protein